MAITIISFLLITTSALSQHWHSWSFEYKLMLDQNNGQSIYTYKSLEVIINEPFQFSKFQSGKVQYNITTKIFTININYGCISCGYFDSNKPPAIFLKINLNEKYHDQQLSIIIPVTAEKIESAGPIDLGTIFINEFIFFNSNFEYFEGIRVKSDLVIEKYEKGKYVFPLPNKLINLEITSVQQ